MNSQERENNVTILAFVYSSPSLRLAFAWRQPYRA